MDDLSKNCLRCPASLACLASIAQYEVWRAYGDTTPEADVGARATVSVVGADYFFNNESDSLCLRRLEWPNVASVAGCPVFERMVQIALEASARSSLVKHWDYLSKRGNIFRYSCRRTGAVAEFEWSP